MDRWSSDRAAMVALPPVAPNIGWQFSTWLAWDHYLRCNANDYSVHPSVIGRRGDLAADLEQVLVTGDGAEVARHHQCWARHQSITDPAHAAAAARLRSAHRSQTRRATDTGGGTGVERRDLADYDRIFGLDHAAADSGQTTAVSA